MEKAISIITSRTFEEKALNDAVKGLQKAFTNIDKNRKDACIIMWRLEDGKKYEKDGFKSLQEFAETIGIDKSTAHKMADAGRVYDSKVPAIAQFADKAGYTNSATLASMLKNDQSDMIEKAIESGDLTPDMTADKVKSWKADTIAQSKPEKVLKDKVFTVFSGLTRDYESYIDVAIHEKSELLTSLDDFSKSYFKIGTVTNIAMYSGESYMKDCAGNDLDGTRKWDVYQSRFDLTVLYVSSVPAKKEKKPVKKSGKDMTREEFERLIEEYRAKFGDAEE